ncbi:MAG: AMP-binding protein, partial [Opitutaceae bacterium]
MKQGIEFNSGDIAPTPFPREAMESSLGRRFEAIATQHPNRIAIRTTKSGWSYANLNRQANRIAHSLLERRRRPEEPVAVLVECGDMLIAALLGVLKSGHIVVPLDPSYPEDRLASMLAESGAAIILTNSRNEALASRLLGSARGPVNLEALAPGLPEDNPRHDVAPQTLAYLLFSSGSTGRPKGIVHSHQNALQNIRSYSLALELSAADRIILLHSVSFSSGVNDVLFALLNGATLYPWDVKAQGLDALGPWMSEHKITVLNWSPTTYRHLLESLPAGVQLSSVRVVMLGSEPVTKLDRDLYCRHFSPEARLVVRLGSTECNNYRLNILNRNSPIPNGTIPGGYAVPDKEVLVLDEAEIPLSVGEMGQIAVRSRYLSPGYWNRPDLTEAAFRPDPAGGDQRIYLTGDFGRLQPDGCLEYLGRRDSQLKFHGIRIEASEIELALTNRVDVRDAVVMVHNDQANHQVLVAYVVPRTRPAPSPRDLHQALLAKLPPAMVPSAFVFLEALPLTPSGKVDRRSLPTLTVEHKTAGNFLVPVTATEKTLAELWAALLQIAQVGRSDHFFNLGGHSLTAVRMLARLQATLAREIPLRVLFEAPTLSEFAARIDGLVGACVAEPTGRVHSISDASPAQGEGGRRPLSPIQEQLHFLQTLEPHNPAYNVATLLKLSGQLDSLALGRAMTEVTRRHEILRAVIIERDGQCEHQIHPLTPLTLRAVDLSDLPAAGREAAARDAAEREAARPFDLSNGPLVRTQLIRLDPHTHWLVINVHHIVFDGASTDILLEELAMLYSAFLAGQPSSLPEPTLQFSAFATWQRKRLASAELARSREHWKKQLTGAPARLDLPVVFPRAAARPHPGRRLAFRLPPERIRQIRTLAQEEEGTPFMVLLAAFQLLLARYSRQEDICIGTPLAARNHFETERLIGYFANTVVLRGNLAGNPTFRELLRRAREVALAALAHAETPLEHVVAALNPGRAAGQTPLFQVALVFNQEALLDPSFGNLAATAEPLHNGAAKFELTLLLRTRPDGVHCAFEYRSDLFSADSIRRMADHFSRLVEQVVTCPDAQIETFDLISPAERKQLLVTWNDTAREFPRGFCIHHLVEAQARATPAATALVAGGERISYAAMNARANQLAHTLRRAGVGPESLVGIFTDRSTETVIALLAVLKAGGAYVPLDPNYPKDRLSFIVEDANVALLITQERLIARLPEQRAPVIVLETADTACESTANPGSEVAATNLAYVIFTSGSTGRPKGVAIEHRSVVAFIAWAQTVFTGAELAGVLFSTSICFDLSVFELFVTLSVGGKVILAENALELPALPAASEVTLVNTVPSVIAELIRNGRLPHSVRTVNLAGEALPTALVDQIYQRSAVAKVYDLYGPSE